MKAKKKIFTVIIMIVITTIAISMVWYFSPRTYLGGIEPYNIKSISVFDGNTGKGFVIKGSEEIKQIVENIQKVKMKRGNISVGYSGYGFSMQFMDENGKVIDSFIINSPNTIRDDPFFYRCDGSLCYDYLKELEAIYA